MRTLPIPSRPANLLALGLMLTAWLPVTDHSVRAETLRAIFQRVDGSVVVVKTTHQQVVTGPKKQLTSLPGLGSGLLVSADGKIMTAAHVVQTADEVKVEFATGEVIAAKVVTSEPAADVALLQLERVPPKAVVAALGNSDLAEVGDEVFIVGAPVGMSHTLTVGHVSARRNPRNFFNGMSRSEFFQTDAAINEGNSGGPMFNMQGEVIGIVSHIVSKSGGFEGLGFVVTSNLARRLLLERNPFWSGVEGFLVSGEMARVFNVPQPAGLLVQRVASHSPAARLGLRPGTLTALIDGEPMVVGGDIILEVQGVPIIPDGSSYTVIRERLTGLKSGDKLVITVLRDGHKEELSTKLP
jgi:serine protease Do